MAFTQINSVEIVLRFRIESNVVNRLDRVLLIADRA